MRSCVAVTLSLLAINVANAQPIDCEKLKYSTAPYELISSFKTKSKASGGGLGPEQVRTPIRSQAYRNSSGITISYSISSQDGKFRKIIYKNGFVTNIIPNSDGGEGTSKFDYKTNIGSDFKAEKKSFSQSYDKEMKVNGETGTIRVEAAFSFKGSDDMIVGPCVFEINKYDVTNKTYVDGKLFGSNAQQISYSKDLRADLYTKILSYDADNVLVFSFESAANSISTDFSPVKE